MSRARKPQRTAPAWEPMGPAERTTPAWKAEALRDMALEAGIDPAEVLAFRDGMELWANDRYVACVFRRDTEPDRGTVKEISVHRHDRKAIRDWRHLQRIKNDIAGDDCEAVELYPAEDRLMDTANEYWLWVAPPGARYPIGFRDRKTATPEEAARVGATQRPL